MKRFTQTRRIRLLALGGGCVLSLGLAGCARDGVKMAEADPNAQSAAEERAADAVARSREALADQERRAKSFRLPIPGTKQVSVEKSKEPVAAAGETKPSLSERLLGGRLSNGLFAKKETAEKGIPDDPFLASGEKSPKAKEAAKKTAVAKNDALDRFLKEQEPISSDRRASVVSYEESAEDEAAAPTKKAVARKSSVESSTSAAERKTAKTSETAKAAIARKPATDRTVAKLEPKKSAARPFPAAGQSPIESKAADTKSTADSTKFVSREFPKDADRTVAKSESKAEPKANLTLKAKQHPLAAQSAVSKAAPPVAADKTGAKIAQLMEQSKAAADEQKYSEALKHAAEAQKLASTSQYRFKKGEEQPAELVAWLATQIDQQSMDASDATEVATRAKPKADSPFATASFSNELGGDPTHHAALDPAPKKSESTLTITEGQRSRKASAAAGIVTPPAWPVLSAPEFQQSDELWQAAAVTADHHERLDANAALRRPMVAHATINAVESNPAPAKPKAKATPSPWTPEEPKADIVIAAAPVEKAPLVELGTPTAAMPEQFATLVASDTSTAATSSRRIAPPPLAISGDVSVAAANDSDDPKASSGGSGRAGWYVAIGLAVATLLVAFRRRIYGGNAT